MTIVHWFEKAMQAWFRLVVSPDEEAYTENWYRARLNASLYPGVILLVAVFYIIRSYLDYSDPGRSTHTGAGLFGLFCMLVALYFNYSRRYSASAMMVIIFGTVLIFFASLGYSDENMIIPLYYLITVLLLGTPFLSFFSTLILIAGHIGLLILRGVISGNLATIATIMEGPILFYVFTGFGILLLTGYRRNREQLRLKSLEESETRYRMISEMISDYAFAYRVDEAGNLQSDWITESAHAITGYQPEELNNAWQQPVLFEEAERRRVRQHVDEAIDGIAGQHAYELVTKGGERRIIRINRRPIWDDKQGRVVRIYGVAQDITMEKETEKEIARLAMERGRLSLIHNFVSAVSHDFRTRLSNVETSRYLISRKVDNENGEKIQQHLDIIRRDVKYLTEQLVNLNMISHLTELKPEPVQLNKLIQDILRVEIHHASDRNIVLRFEPDETVPVLQLDKSEIFRAIQHLVTNAINYTGRGGKVFIYTEHKASEIHIRVTDTGQGIAAEHLPHIFDLFYRADPARSLQTGGVGLGLSLAKMIVEAHDGRLDVESEEDRGSTFTMILPETSDVRLVPAHELSD